MGGSSFFQLLLKGKFSTIFNEHHFKSHVKRLILCVTIIRVMLNEEVTRVQVISNNIRVTIVFLHAWCFLIVEYGTKIF